GPPGTSSPPSPPCGGGGATPSRTEPPATARTATPRPAAGFSRRARRPGPGPRAVGGLSRHRHRRDSPDLLGVLPARAIARNLAHATRVPDGLPRPLGPVAIRPGNPGLAGDVRGVVGQEQVAIPAVQQGVNDGGEPIRLARAEGAVPDHVQYPPEL